MAPLDFCIFFVNSVSSLACQWCVQAKYVKSDYIKLVK